MMSEQCSLYGAPNSQSRQCQSTGLGPKSTPHLRAHWGRILWRLINLLLSGSERNHAFSNAVLFNGYFIRGEPCLGLLGLQVVAESLPVTEARAALKSQRSLVCPHELQNAHGSQIIHITSLLACLMSAEVHVRMEAHHIERNCNMGLRQMPQLFRSPMSTTHERGHFEGNQDPVGEGKILKLAGCKPSSHSISVDGLGVTLISMA